MAIRSRVREAARRLALGVVLALGAGVGLGDDVKGVPDVRRGSRGVRLDLPHLGTTPVHIPQSAPTGVVLLLHRGGSAAEIAALTHAVPWHVLLVDVDVARLSAPDASASCDATSALLEDISRRAQREAGLTTYHRPVVVATTGALPVAAAALQGASPAVLPAAVSVGSPVAATRPACVPATTRRITTAAAQRWRYAPTPLALASPLEDALGVAANDTPRAATDVQRWLQHFDLPLTAAWSSHPCGMLVLLSPARGWREADEALSRRLADAGIHVVGIDALQSFWQRRSPRDVALELQRLTDALASTGLPVYVGGREFGAETMAVAAEMMPSNHQVAGVVLVDPGPTAFFEVEPPALALRPLGPSEWSTRAAVQQLDRPTLCVTHAPSPAARLCESLARRGQATHARSGADVSALAHTIASFIRPPS